MSYRERKPHSLWDEGGLLTCFLLCWTSYLAPVIRAPEVGEGWRWEDPAPCSALAVGGAHRL